MTKTDKQMKLLSLLEAINNENISYGECAELCDMATELDEIVSGYKYLEENIMTLKQWANVGE